MYLVGLRVILDTSSRYFVTAGRVEYYAYYDIPNLRIQLGLHIYYKMIHGPYNIKLQAVYTFTQEKGEFVIFLPLWNINN